MNRRRTSRGFTLVEVLMGILILALALLGIGAVIPVVVRTQKIATDATLGVAVANAAESLVLSRPDLNRLQPPPVGGNPPVGRMGWGVWLLDQNWSPDLAYAPSAADAYLWEPLLNTELVPDTGRVHLEYSGSNPLSPVTIEVADRLWPPRNSTGTTPQFVWDFIARRVRTPAGTPHQIQLAIFVRRLDPNVRVRSGLSLYEAVCGYEIGTFNVVSAADRRLPVAVSNLAGNSAGLPTLNGMGEYAAPLVLDLDDNAVGTQRDRLLTVPNSVTTNEFALATQVGQKWVDNLGNVYTVRGVDPRDANGATVLIEPPLPAWVQDVNAANADETAIRQVAFVPQVPAAVSVVTLTPSDPKP